MIIKTLVENTKSSEEFESEHGISFFINYDNHNLLFDLGQTDLFIKNAKKLNVNLNDIESVVISHGHNDHGGGLENFLNINKKAKIYINYLAFEKHYAKRLNDHFEYIGLDRNLIASNQIVYTKDYYEINDTSFLFSNINQHYRLPLSNNILYTKDNDKYVHDTFMHEQNLVINDNGKLILFTGCSHNGILNIVEHFNSLIGRYPDVVIGGFHLSSRTAGSESETYVKELAKALLKTNAKYYTCHCTGLNNYEILKEVMKDKIDYLSTGKTIEI